MNNEIIVIKQLPVIEEKLKEIKEQVTAKVDNAMSLVCTQDTLTAVKKARAELNKDFKEFEKKRKDVKNAVMQPYNQFEAVYKDCVTEVFKKADVDLKSKIDSVENELKEKKEKEIQAYFNEYLASKNIPIALNICDCKLNITLSASIKSLKEQVKATIDRVCDDLNLIETQEHKDEILFEYKKNLNVQTAITTVINRYKAIEEAKAKEVDRQKKAEAEKKAIEKVEAVVETLTPPTVVEPITPVKVKKFTFEVIASDNKIKKLIEFLESEDFDYEYI